MNIALYLQKMAVHVCNVFIASCKMAVHTCNVVCACKNMQDSCLLANGGMQVIRKSHYRLGIQLAWEDGS